VLSCYGTADPGTLAVPNDLHRALADEQVVSGPLHLIAAALLVMTVNAYSLVSDKFFQIYLIHLQKASGTGSFKGTANAFFRRSTPDANVRCCEVSTGRK
jgi:hypothetical protein